MADKEPLYSNPQLPEGINTSPQHPVATFIKLFSAILLILIVSAWLLGKSGNYLASLVPFEKEVQLASQYELEPDSDANIQLYLENLAAHISDAMALPEGMEIHIHYINEDIENAFATLGGHIFIYKGLLKKLPNENAISMVIAHEIAHILYRDPIRALGQNVAISSGLALLLGHSDVQLLGATGLYTQLKFSRDMETQADVAALKALVNVYGHANGATDLFKVLMDLEESMPNFRESNFFVTHPLGENRIKKIENIAKTNGWVLDKATKALPQGFQSWLDNPEKD